MDEFIIKPLKAQKFTELIQIRLADLNLTTI